MNENQIALVSAELETFLAKNDIKYHARNNRISLYLSDSYGNTSKEIILYMKLKQYSMGITTSVGLSMSEHKLLTEIFKILNWL